MVADNPNLKPTQAKQLIKKFWFKSKMNGHWELVATDNPQEYEDNGYFGMTYDECEKFIKNFIQ